MDGNVCLIAGFLICSSIVDTMDLLERGGQMDELSGLDREYWHQLCATMHEYDKISDRSFTVMGKAMGWLHDQFIFNTHRSSDSSVDLMIAEGRRFYSDFERQFSAVNSIINRASFEDDLKILDEAKMVIGQYNPILYCAEAYRLFKFCRLYSTTVERHCMQFNLPAGSGIPLAAFFYRYALRWELFKSLFAI